MEVLAESAIGGVCIVELLTFIIYLRPDIDSSRTPPGAAALSTRQLTEAPSAGSASWLRTYVHVRLAREVVTTTPVARQAHRQAWQH
jgi:hypothetical protein